MTRVASGMGAAPLQVRNERGRNAGVLLSKPFFAVLQTVIHILCR